MPPPTAPVDLLRIESVLARTGYSRSGWYRAIRSKRAPPGQQRGSTTVWSSHVIDGFNRWQADTLPFASR